MTKKTEVNDYKDEPIAVVGMECIFPQAENKSKFWQNILQSVNAIGDPLPAWEAEHYIKTGHVSTQKGGYLRDLYRFNPSEFGIMPNSVDGGEPDQYLALHVAKQALLDAGEHYADADYDHRDTGIILGHSSYYHRGQVNGAQQFAGIDQTIDILRAVMPDMTAEQEGVIRDNLKAQLPPFNSDMCAAMVPNVMTGRIANRLDFTGPNYLVDAACASSLLAVNAAIEELRSGNSRMMLAGGVNASLPPEVSIIFTLLDALSASGKVSPFSTDSDGTLLGEGLGVVVLKRLSDALADGDRIYSLVHGVGQSSDGKGFSMLAPSERGEVLAMERAYNATGIAPESISLVEAHGTGIALGDQTEISSLKHVFGKRQGEQGNIALGSVKSMISHCIPAAGIASFIKMSLALYHKTLPPTLCDTVNPDLGIEDTALYINTECKPWVHSAAKPRRAAINSFGFGGVNAHAILEEAPKQAEKPALCAPWSEEICVFAATDKAALLTQLQQLDAFLNAREDVRLSDVAYSLWKEAEGNEGVHRVALVATDIADVKKKLTQIIGKLEKSDKALMGRNGVFYVNAPMDGKLAFMFPGEGSQYMGMLSDLAQHFESVREWMDFWHTLYDETPGSTRTDVLYPVKSELSEERKEALGLALHRMDIGSESVFIADQAMHALLDYLGVSPDVMVGHSSGESAALVAARAVPWKDHAQLGELVRRLNRIAGLVDEQGGIETGALMAVGLVSKDVIEKTIGKGKSVIAMENCPTQTIVYGSEKDVAALSEKLAEQGAVCEILPFDRGYHTPAFAPMKNAFVDYYKDIGLGAPSVPLYSCATAKPFPKTKGDVLEVATRQWITSVRFIDTVHAMHDDGVRYFVEVGPSGKLASFAEQILRGKESFISASNLEAKTGLHQLLVLMGKLFVYGKADAGKLFAGREVRQLDLAQVKAPVKKSLFLDNSIPKLRATDELKSLLQQVQPVAAQPAAMQASAEDALADYRPFFSAITAWDGLQFAGDVYLNSAEDNFLQDHILSGVVSESDGSLQGLACVPMMVSLEIMAEAAAMLAGRLDLAAIEQVQAFDWIALDDGQVHLQVQATVLDASTGRYHVTIANGGNIVVAADYLFAVQPQAVAAVAPLQQPEAYKWPGDYALYQDGMFHGPLFQTVKAIAGWGEQGIDAELSPASLDHFFRNGEAVNFVINPSLLDALNQLTAYWVRQKVGPNFNTFPSSIARIDFYASCPQGMDGMVAQARKADDASEHGDGEWNILCSDAQAQPLIQLTGLQNIYAPAPMEYYQCYASPLQGWMGAPVEAVEGMLQWHAHYLPEDFCRKSNSIFLRMLACSMLNHAERGQWQQLPHDVAVRCDWLFARVALKQAVRYWVYQQSGELLYPSDIEVVQDVHGQFFVSGWWAEQLATPAVTLQLGQQELWVNVTVAQDLPAAHYG